MKGRIFYGKEQTEILDGCGATARHVDPDEPVRGGGSVRPGASGEGGTGTALYEEWQVFTALNRKRALASGLMERICERGNLNRAYKRVKANEGAFGVDAMTVKELSSWLKEHKDGLIASLLDGDYEPRPVLGVEIEEPEGGKRQLGIPTVVDRLVQQAILQVLEGIVDPTFSESSYGFRRGRNAHQALQRVAKYVGDVRGDSGGHRPGEAF